MCVKEELVDVATREESACAAQNGDVCRCLEKLANHMPLLCTAHVTGEPPRGGMVGFFSVVVDLDQ